MLLQPSAQENSPNHTDISACCWSFRDFITAAALKENSSKCYSAPTSYLSLWSCSSFSSFSLFWVSFLRQQSSWLTVSSSDSKFLDSSADLLLLQTKPEVNNNSYPFSSALPYPVWEATSSHSAGNQCSVQRAHSQLPRAKTTSHSTCLRRGSPLPVEGTIQHLSKESKSSHDNTKPNALILTYFAALSAKCCCLFLQTTFFFSQ